MEENAFRARNNKEIGSHSQFKSNQQLSKDEWVSL